MIDLWAALAPYLTIDKSLALARALALIAIGFGVAKLLARAAWKLTSERLARQQAVLFRRGVFYGILLLFLVASFHELGFRLGVLLGAAGVLSVAVGFASQTSASNLISGLFLIAEQPFSIGDVIQVGGTTGEVLSIDLLSVKLRTFDNQFVRIPNESLIKTEVRTLTRFPIRRVDLRIGVAYKEDIERVRDLLFDLAHEDPLCLEEPAPFFVIVGFGDSAIDLQFSPWTAIENYTAFKNSVQLEIKRRFEAEGIEIPFPQRSLVAGSGSDPFPVKLTDGGEGGEH
jgi:small-conductance mechanosensitive channel